MEHNVAYTTPNLAAFIAIAFPTQHDAHIGAYRWDRRLRASAAAIAALTSDLKSGKL